MSKKFWVDGSCYICGIHTLEKCDGCERFTCECHSKKIKQGDVRLDICQKCIKSLKPGMKVAGVKISEKALGLG